MPLFGKKSPSGSKSKEASPASPSASSTSASDKKVPTVEDKYTLKDLLGT